MPVVGKKEEEKAEDHSLYFSGINDTLTFSVEK